MKATPIPTRSGWCTFQNTSTSARKSGIHGTRPSGNMFSSSATIRLLQIKTGLAGSNSCWPDRMIMLSFLARSFGSAFLDGHFRRASDGP